MQLILFTSLEKVRSIVIISIVLNVNMHQLKKEEFLLKKSKKDDSSDKKQTYVFFNVIFMDAPPERISSFSLLKKKFFVPTVGNLRTRDIECS